jgi:sulfotransferase family protein
VKIEDPLFVLAPPRSFTSLVAAILGQHPCLYGLPELNLFQAKTMDEFWKGREPDGRMKSPFWPVMRHGLLRTVAQFYAGEQTIESVKMAERWIQVRKTASTGEVFRELCAKAAPLRLVEKSPGTIRKREYLDRLLLTFPGSCFIHLLRHPRSQGESVLNTKGGAMVLFLLGAIDNRGPEPVLDPQILWHDSHVQIATFLDELPPSQWMRVRGEDFFHDIDNTLTRICGWLGMPADAEALEAMKHPERSPFSCVGPANARLGNDINFLESPALRAGKPKTHSLAEPLAWRPDGASFHPRVAALAREFGYE